MSYAYMDNLSATALDRYRLKLKLVGMDKCPYKHPADSWINCPKEWPKLEYPDVYHYLIKTPGVYTTSTMDNYKSLEAYNFFVSGWVQTITHKKVTPNHIIFRADVKPSWRVTKKPHHPWVAVSTEARVLAAHCDCMAGLRETCSHIAAVLFKVEAAVRLGYTNSTCTDESCRWNACSVNKVEAAPVVRIQFYTQKAKDRLLQSKRIKLEGPTPSTADEQMQFLNSMAELPEELVGLCAFKEHCDRFVSSQPAVVKVCLPQNLCNLYKADTSVDTANLGLSVLPSSANM